MSKHRQKKKRNPRQIQIIAVTGGNDCVICLNKFSDRFKLDCGHEYDAMCIQKWFRVCKLASCPVCQKIHNNTARPPVDNSIYTHIYFFMLVIVIAGFMLGIPALLGKIFAR